MISISKLDSLPLFANDNDIAEALVGKKRAAEWVEKRLPTISTLSGFPKVDDLHGGRPVPLVKMFYENYLHMPKSNAVGGAPGGKEDPSAWRRSKRTV